MPSASSAITISTPRLDRDGVSDGVSDGGGIRSSGAGVIAMGAAAIGAGIGATPVGGATAATTAGGAAAVSNARANAPMVGKRSSFCLASARRSTASTGAGTPGTAADSGGGSWWTIWASRSFSVAPWNGSVPLSMRQTRQASAH